MNAPLPKPKDFDPQQKAAKENVFGDRIEDMPPPQNRVGMSVEGSFPTISLVSLGSPPNKPDPGDPIRGYYVEADSGAAGRVTSTMPSQTGQTGERSTSQAKVKVRALPVPTPVLDRYRIVQLWEGTITDFGNKTFGATLRDLTGSAGDERATFSMDEVDEDDQRLVAVGAVFYWSMGYHHDARGTRHLSNDLRFRRLPVWRKADLQKLSEPSEFDKFFS